MNSGKFYTILRGYGHKYSIGDDEIVIKQTCFGKIIEFSNRPTQNFPDTYNGSILWNHKIANLPITSASWNNKKI